MSDPKNPKNISWDDFVKMGNPENIPEPKDKIHTSNIDYDQVVRVHLEKKGRGGKTVSIIKGLVADGTYLKALAKELKSACGVGGSFKDDIIIIQGNHREKIKNILLEKGYKDVKLAGG